MKSTAKHIQRSNIIVTFPEGVVAPPDASQIFALYSGEQSKGSTFLDTPSMATRIFEFPAIGFQWIFEPGRVRLEDRMSRPPKDSHLAREMCRALKTLYPGKIPAAYGYNYDMIYRMGGVIPTREVMGNFLTESSIEEVKDFGWQYTLAKDKGKRAETYFFKVVSPIEYAVHANFHFNSAVLPKDDDLQASFERCYADADGSLSHISFV